MWTYYKLACMQGASVASVLSIDYGGRVTHLCVELIPVHRVNPRAYLDGQAFGFFSLADVDVPLIVELECFY